MAKNEQRDAELQPDDVSGRAPVAEAHARAHAGDCAGARAQREIKPGRDKEGEPSIERHAGAIGN
jgi:hypothetical protein